MFGWGFKTEQLKGVAFERERDRISALVAGPGKRKLAIRRTVPLFGFTGRRCRVGLWQRVLGWFSPVLRKDLGQVAFDYRILRRSFTGKAFTTQLGERQKTIHRQLAKLKGWRTRRTKAQSLAKDLVKQYQELVPKLQSLFHRMGKLRQLSSVWEKREKERLVFLYWKRGAKYEYRNQDTKRNVEFLKGLKERLVDEELAGVDDALRSLSSGGKDLVGILEDIVGARQGLRKDFLRLEKIMEQKVLSATDRYKAGEELERLKTLAGDYTSLGSELEKMSEALKEGELGGAKFREKERGLRKRFEGLEHRRKGAQRAMHRFLSRVEKLSPVEQQANREAANFTRQFLLDVISQESGHWIEDTAKGKISELTEELWADQQFRRFTQYVTTVGPRMGLNRGVSGILLKDYPYVVRDFGKDLEKVYRAIHDANLIYLRQMAGTLGKELPPHIPHLEKQISHQTGLPRFIENNARETVDHFLRERAEEEQTKWMTFILRFAQEEMIQSNRSRRKRPL